VIELSGGPGPVRLQPVLPLAPALGRGRPSAAGPFPLSRERLLLTFSGTVALYQAFRALELPPGSTVLCPSYNCGHEIEPLVRLGLQVQCYRVGLDLKPDLRDIERRMGPEIRALLVTHYFGFAQPLAELRTLCDRRGIRLV
jgi:perosamine synthetase